MKQHHLSLIIVLLFNSLLLFFAASTLSISYNEAHSYFGYHGVVGYISHLFVPLFGQNDFAIRLPMILMHLISMILLYQISKFYIKEQFYQIVLLIIYALLPGVISSALLINSAGLVIMLTFLFIYLYKMKHDSLLIYILLGFYALLNHSFVYLFLALALYAIAYKKYLFFLANILYIMINSYIYPTDIGGFPTGHFLDALGVYAAIFSPIVFIYIVYALYRSYLMQQRDIVWYIATVALLFSLLLSLRQKVHIEYYAPFVMAALPIAAKIFLSSYKVRLPQFRKGYKILFMLLFSFLILNVILVLGNRYLYLFLENPKKHFAYDHHIAKELAQKLHDLDIKCIMTDYKMQLRLEFYDISKCEAYQLLPYKTKKSLDVTISYNNKIIYQAYVTKINN